MILASPDLDPDLFERTYKRLQTRGATSTIYAASNDRALAAASWLKGQPPLGYLPADGPERLVAGTDLIDITAVNTDFFSLNHDTYANSPVLIADLRHLLKEG
jgi:esterase/lipase superfamily enzyme